MSGTYPFLAFVGRIYRCDFGGPEGSASFLHDHGPTRRKTLPPPSSCACEFKGQQTPFYQGIYPTIIVVVVTMRLSAADILSCPGATTATGDSRIVFRSPSPSPRSSMAEDVESASGSECIAVSPDAISTRTLVSSLPDK